ncbi:HEAT repeat domain-containing protein [Planctomycetota bacterium]
MSKKMCLKDVWKQASAIDETKLDITARRALDRTGQPLSNGNVKPSGSTFPGKMVFLLATAAILLFGAFQFLPYFSQIPPKEPEMEQKIEVAAPEKTLFKLFDIMGQDPDYHALISHGVISDPALYQAGDKLGDYLVTQIEESSVTLESMDEDTAPLTLTPALEGAGPDTSTLALAYGRRSLSAEEYHQIVERAFAGDGEALKIIALIAGNPNDPFHEQILSHFGSKQDIEVASQLLAKARDKNKRVRLEAVKTLRHARGPLPLAFFREILSNENDRLITFAIDIIVDRLDLRSLPALMELQGSTSNPKLAKACAKAISVLMNDKGK